MRQSSEKHLEEMVSADGQGALAVLPYPVLEQQPGWG